jgi:formate dehydrogenase gamma subunit
MKIADDNLDVMVETRMPARLAGGSVDEETLMPDDEVFVRFTLSQRIQHIVLIGSFFTLVLTGLPVLFPDLPLIHKLFFFESSFWLRGIIHRIAGVTLMGLGVFQVVYVMVSKLGNEDFLKMIPTPRDARDAVGQILYNLGIRSEQPKFGKFNFGEKFEYWALIWGTLLMAVTGLLLWFHEAAIALFPLRILDIVRIVHGFEAILAFLAILIWHMYHVFLKPEIFPMNKTWITGTLSKKELQERHPLEYEAILEARREEHEIERVKALLEEVRRGSGVVFGAKREEALLEEGEKCVI